MRDEFDPAIREAERLRRQAALDAGKTTRERNRLGQFATPPALAEAVVRAAIAELPLDARLRFLDPALGTGAFYSALVREHASRVERAVGFELDPHYGRPALELWSRFGLDVREVDFTAAEPAGDERFNLVVCNPPYVRHHHLPSDQKLRLREAVTRRTGVALHGLAGLYCHFLLLATTWTSPGGIAAWLVPSEFMDVNYGAAVKRFLLDRVTLLRVHRFDPGDAQFDDALVSSAVVLFRNSPPSVDRESVAASIRFSYGGSLESPREVADVSPRELERVAKWTSLPPRSPASASAAVTSARVDRRAGEIPSRAERAADARLGDLFAIKRGIATGANSFFVMTAERAAEREIPGEFLRPLLPSPRRLTDDEILADPAGRPLVAQPRWLLDCRLPPGEVAARFPSLWAYLEAGVAAGVDRGYLCSRRTPWYAQEDRPAAPFLCTYMGRGREGGAPPFRFLLNHSLATAANTYLLLYPRPTLAARLGDDPDARRALWRALRSLAGETLAREGRVYGGGLHKLEPRELANVPADSLLDLLAAR